MQPAPKAIRTSHEGEAARRQWRARKVGEEPYAGPTKRRLSDNKRPTNFLRIYYLRPSATDNEIEAAIRHEVDPREDFYLWRLRDRHYALLAFAHLLDAYFTKKAMEHKFYGWIVREQHANGFYEHKAAASLKVDYINITTAKAITEAEKTEALREGLQDMRVLPLPKKSMAEQQRDFREARNGAVGKMWAEAEYEFVTADKTCIKKESKDDFWDELQLTDADLGLDMQKAEQALNAAIKDDFYDELVLTEADLGI